MLAVIAGDGVRTILIESPDRFARDLAVQLAGHDHLKRLGDIEERKFWKRYMTAYEECLSATSTRDAPWYVVHLRSFTVTVLRRSRAQ
jgi:hypothetical protein